MDDEFLWISFDSGFELLDTSLVIVAGCEIGVILLDVKIVCLKLESLVLGILLSLCGR